MLSDILLLIPSRVFFWWAAVHGVAKSRAQLSDFSFFFQSEGINSRIPETEERISELEDKMVEITAEE